MEQTPDTMEQTQEFSTCVGVFATNGHAEVTVVTPSTTFETPKPIQTDI